MTTSERSRSRTSTLQYVLFSFIIFGLLIVCSEWYLGANVLNINPTTLVPSFTLYSQAPNDMLLWTVCSKLPGKSCFCLWRDPLFRKLLPSKKKKLLPFPFQSVQKMVRKKLTACWLLIEPFCQLLWIEPGWKGHKEQGACIHLEVISLLAVCYLSYTKTLFHMNDKAEKLMHLCPSAL